MLNPQKSQVRLGRVLSFTASHEAVYTARQVCDILGFNGGVVEDVNLVKFCTVSSGGC